MPAAVSEPHRSTGIQDTVLQWYATSGRPLNFRRTRDPYAVLISEAMAQQTQIARVEPAWDAFMARFPTIAVLAAASPADVLRQWQGLGYNRRALNLQRAARAIVEDHDGRVPSDVETLMTLPGIGPYTARAVAAIAFEQNVGAVDTNIRRVLGRAVLGEAEAEPGPRLQALADGLVPDGRAGAWTHGLMDIGERFCRPRGPRCEECPLAEVCRFRVEGAATARRGSPKSSQPFPSTTRWLRGRILDSARAASDDAWIRIDERYGTHSAEAATAAARAMVNEGLLEPHPAEPGLARLPR